MADEQGCAARPIPSRLYRRYLGATRQRRPTEPGASTGDLHGITLLVAEQLWPTAGRGEASRSAPDVHDHGLRPSEQACATPKEDDWKQKRFPAAVRSGTRTGRPRPTLCQLTTTSTPTAVPLRNTATLRP